LCKISVKGLPDPGNGEIYFKLYVDANDDEDFNDGNEVVTSKVYNIDVGDDFGPLDPQDGSGNDLIVTTGQTNIAVKLEIYDKDIPFEDDLLYQSIEFPVDTRRTANPPIEDSSGWVEVTWIPQSTVPPELESRRDDIQKICSEYESIITSKEYSEGKESISKIYEDCFLLPKSTVEYIDEETYHKDAVSEAQKRGSTADPGNGDVVIVILPEHIMARLDLSFSVTPFDMPLEFESDLDGGVISSAFLEAFNNNINENKLKLSENAWVKIEVKGIRWWITETGKAEYVIMKERIGNLVKLNVYHHSHIGWGKANRVWVVIDDSSARLWAHETGHAKYDLGHHYYLEVGERYCIMDTLGDKNSPSNALCVAHKMQAEFVDKNEKNQSGKYSSYQPFSMNFQSKNKEIVFEKRENNYFVFQIMPHKVEELEKQSNSLDYADNYVGLKSIDENNVELFFFDASVTTDKDFYNIGETIDITANVARPDGNSKVTNNDVTVEVDISTHGTPIVEGLSLEYQGPGIWKGYYSIQDSDPGGTWLLVAKIEDTYNHSQIETKTLAITIETPDTTPPVWDSTIGIQSLTPGDRELTATWGTATDTQSPPVTYNLYYHTSLPATDGTKISNATSLDVITGLTNGQKYYVTVRAQDSATPPNEDKNDATQEATPTPEPEPLQITTESPLPAGTVGEPYSRTLQAKGGTPKYIWSITAGNLPDGLTLNQATSEISGTPTTADTFHFTVQVRDSKNQTDTQDLSITIQTAQINDNAEHISKTIPDGKEMSPNQSFTQTWTIKNTGNTTWNTSYKLVYVSGDQMSTLSYVNLTQSVSPQNTIDISVDMVAPATPNTYQGYWRMKNAAGAPFGVTIHVKIIVPQASKTYSCSLHAQNPKKESTITVKSDSLLYVEVDYENTGTNNTWVNTSASDPNYIELRSCNENGAEVDSKLYHSSWISQKRVGTYLEIQKGVAPGQKARFVFIIYINPDLMPVRNDPYLIYFRPYHNTAGWIEDWGKMYFSIKVSQQITKPQKWDTPAELSKWEMSNDIEAHSFWPDATSNETKGYMVLNPGPTDPQIQSPELAINLQDIDIISLYGANMGDKTTTKFYLQIDHKPYSEDNVIEVQFPNDHHWHTVIGNIKEIQDWNTGNEITRLRIDPVEQGVPVSGDDNFFIGSIEIGNCFFADLDCDGEVNTEDVRRISLHWNTQVGEDLYNPQYDFNSDNKINLLDVRKVAQYWGQTAPFNSPAAPAIKSLNSEANTAIVRVNPSNQEVAINTKTTFTIEIEKVDNLGAIEFTLRYNPSIIEIQGDGVKIGDFLSKSHLLPLGPKFKDSDAFRELTYGLSLLGNEPGPSGNGVIVQIEVKGINAGTTVLDLTSVQMVDATLDLKPIPTETISGAITVPSEVICGIEGVENTTLTTQNNATVLPAQNKLFQNYPNPFNPDTWIPYQLAKASEVRIRIYNVKGRLVRTLHLGHKHAGYYQDKTASAYWNGRNKTEEAVSNGMYFYHLQAGEFHSIRKMLIAK